MQNYCSNDSTNAKLPYLCVHKLKTSSKGISNSKRELRIAGVFVYIWMVEEFWIYIFHLYSKIADSFGRWRNFDYHGF